MKIIKAKAQKRIAKSLNEIISAAFEDTKKDPAEFRKLVRNVCNICVDCKLEPSVVIPYEIPNTAKTQRTKPPRGSKGEDA